MKDGYLEIDLDVKRDGAIEKLLAADIIDWANIGRVALLSEYILMCTSRVKSFDEAHGNCLSYQILASATDHHDSSIGFSRGIGDRSRECFFLLEKS